MAAGILKMWNADRGFGFIKDDSGGPDILMHVTALRGIDPDNLGLGERLIFDVERDARSGKIKAANVRRPG
jgi:CspA family cold shock protein